MRALESMRGSPIFQLLIMLSIKIAAENIHCAFGLNVFLSFHSLQSLMSLSKLQKLDPSEIDKCAMVFVRLWPVKKKKLRRFLTPLRNLQTLAEFIASFTSEE